MKVKVLNEIYNPLLKRKELQLEIAHDSSGTPNRVIAKQDIATQLGENAQKIHIISMKTLTGTNKAICKAELYDDPDRSKKIVPPYIQQRELPKAESQGTEKKPKEEKAKKEKPAIPAKVEDKKEAKQKTDSQIKEKSQAKETKK